MILAPRTCTSILARDFPLPLPDTANLGADWAIWTAGIAASAVYMMRYETVEMTAQGAPDIEVKPRTYFNPGA